MNSKAGYLPGKVRDGYQRARTPSASRAMLLLLMLMLLMLLLLRSEQ